MSGRAGMVRLLSGALALAVVALTVVVLTGVGQGSPPPKLKIDPAASLREIVAYRDASATVHAGGQLFDAHGCDDCHTMAIPRYDGQIGPRLDIQSQGDSVSAVEMNIEHPPDDDKGYEAGLMPENFGVRLSPHDLHALAVYIHAMASAAQGPGHH